MWPLVFCYVPQLHLGRTPVGFCYFYLWISVCQPQTNALFLFLLWAQHLMHWKPTTSKICLFQTETFWWKCWEQVNLITGYLYPSICKELESDPISTKPVDIHELCQFIMLLGFFFNEQLISWMNSTTKSIKIDSKWIRMKP